MQEKYPLHEIRKKNGRKQKAWRKRAERERDGERKGLRVKKAERTKASFVLVIYRPSNPLIHHYFSFSSFVWSWVFILEKKADA